MKGVVLQHLLLQKPTRDSKAKDHARHLLRRLDLWLNGDLDELLNEGKCIQNRLRLRRSHSTKSTLAQTFARKVKQGNVQGAFAIPLWGQLERGFELGGHGQG